MQEITKKMAEQRAALIEENLAAISEATIFAVDVHVPTVLGGTIIYQLPAKSQAVQVAMQSIRVTSKEWPACE